jgi:hypothetical protein
MAGLSQTSLVCIERSKIENSLNQTKKIIVLNFVNRKSLFSFTGIIEDQQTTTYHEKENLKQEERNDITHDEELH